MHSGEFRLIDFNRGLVTYPATLNEDEQWNPDAGLYTLIMKSHDQYHLDLLPNTKST